MLRVPAMAIFSHDDVIKWKHFPRYWPFVRGIHLSPVDSIHKGQWRGVWCFLAPDQRLSKQTRRRWSETPPRSLWHHSNGGLWALFQYKMSSYLYRKSYCVDTMILWPSYPHNGFSYIGKTASSYWTRALTEFFTRWLLALTVIFREILMATLIQYHWWPR